MVVSVHPDREFGGLKYSSRDQGYFDRSILLRVLIVVLFVACLFLFLHFREERTEVMELGSIAQRYVVAQVDFEFYDEEATIILKQEAVRDIGRIFEFSDKDIQQRRLEFENYLITQQEWREQARQSTFEELYEGIDWIEKKMTDLRFTDPRTLRKMNELNMGVENYIVFSPGDVSSAILLPELLWQQIQEKAGAEAKLQKSTVDFIVGLFQKKAWTLQEDIPEQRALRKLVQSKIPDKFTKVSAGNRIIDQGEKVTTRHLAMMQAMKDAISKGRNLGSPVTLLGSLLMTLVFTMLCLAYVFLFEEEVGHSNSRLFLTGTVFVLTLLLAKGFDLVLGTSSMHFADHVRYPLFAPFAAMLLCNLMPSRLAISVSVFISLVLTVTLAVEHHEFLITNVVAAVVAVLSSRRLRRRKDVFVVASLAWLSCAFLIVAFHLYAGQAVSLVLAVDLVSSFLFMLFTAVLVVGLLPLLESTFKVMTDVTMMEYMNPHHALTRRLSIESPGTYQHSIVVGNVAEAAALAIGANGLFCRVACLFHDIGKLTTPQYFAENQQGGVNIHQLLTPVESAQVIVNHVKEGVALARKSGLPEPLIDVIKEHHGTTLVYYFYRRYQDQVGLEKAAAEEAAFRYAGPKPHSKESAIIMIADTVEAASRTLEEINEETVTGLVHMMVKQKEEDGQFDDCQLTFEELGVIKKAVIKTLVAAGHARVKYPVRK